MSDKDDGAAFCAQLTEGLSDADLAFGVDPGGWLIEHIEVSVLGERRGDHRPSLLATGEFVESIATSFSQSHLFQRRGDALTVTALRESMSRRNQSGAHNLVDGHGDRTGGVQTLRDIGQFVPRPKTLQWETKEMNSA